LTGPVNWLSCSALASLYYLLAFPKTHYSVPVLILVLLPGPVN
jgi:hypothetical protein